MSNDFTPGDMQQQQSYQPPLPPQKKDNTAMLVLSYLWILFLVPMLTEKEDPDVQWHAKHGMVLFIAEVILWVVVGFLYFILSFIPVLGWILGCLLFAVAWIGPLVIRIMCIMKATKGERMIIPMVTEFVTKF